MFGEGVGAPAPETDNSRPPVRVNGMKERVLTGSGHGERALPASRRALARPRANRNPLLTSLRITSSYPSVNSENATTKYTTTYAGEYAGAASVIVVPGCSFRQDMVHDIAWYYPRQDA
jgi:hypothetical protein